jgi:competence protein ComEA
VAASADDPVVLNTAFAADLRRLPGIGEKRANAILALRVRMGRFRALEDLLKVKGIGRATLKRLRPFLRLDSKPSDAGAAPAATNSER